jgi:HAD superfamily hydrolase (TIGR01509 family)
MTVGTNASLIQGLLRGKSLLIFDFDGTIADTSPLHARAFESVLAPMGVGVKYEHIAGMRTLDAIYQAFERNAVTVDDETAKYLAQQKQIVVRELIQASLEPLPGVLAFIDWAVPRFGICMVSSGSRATIQMSLQVLGLDGVFSPLICGDDVSRGKPDPEGFLMALSMTDTAASNALVFEDSESGMRAAVAAGIEVIDASKPDWCGQFFQLSQPIVSV